MKKNYLSFIATMFMLFTVLDLQSQEVVSVVSAGTTEYRAPLEVYYNNSYGENIYLSSQIGSSGDIDEIQLQWNGNEALTRSVVIYMGHTSISGFTTYSELGRNSSGYTEVFSGNVTLPASAGWVTITLDTPFSYNGSDNLLVAYNDTTGSYASSSSKFLHTSTGGDLRTCLLYTSPSPRDNGRSRMPSSA